MSAPSSSTSHGALDPADPLVYDAVWESNPHTVTACGLPPRPTSHVRLFFFLLSYRRPNPSPRSCHFRQPGRRTVDIYAARPSIGESSDSTMRERKLYAIEPSANPGTQRRTKSNRNTPPHMVHLLQPYPNIRVKRDKKGVYRG